jgi:hypothetical protein
LLNIETSEKDKDKVERQSAKAEEEDNNNQQPFQTRDKEVIYIKKKKKRDKEVDVIDKMNCNHFVAVIEISMFPKQRVWNISAITLLKSIIK